MHCISFYICACNNFVHFVSDLSCIMCINCAIYCILCIVLHFKRKPLHYFFVPCRADTGCKSGSPVCQSVCLVNPNSFCLHIDPQVRTITITTIVIISLVCVFSSVPFFQDQWEVWSGIGETTRPTLIEITLVWQSKFDTSNKKYKVCNTTLNQAML